MLARDASAMFVATITLRLPGGAGSKIRVCISDGSAEYTARGYTGRQARSCQGNAWVSAYARIHAKNATAAWNMPILSTRILG